MPAASTLAAWPLRFCHLCYSLAAGMCRWVRGDFLQGPAALRGFSPRSVMIPPAPRGYPCILRLTHTRLDRLRPQDSGERMDDKVGEASVQPQALPAPEGQVLLRRSPVLSTPTSGPGQRPTCVLVGKSDLPGRQVRPA